MKSVSLILLLLLTLCSSGVASDFAISLDTVVGLYGPNSLNTNQQITFYLRLTNNGIYPMKGITNGFRVYSPDGVTWDTTVGDNNLGTIGSSDFDLIWHINEFGLTGSGVDTLGFSGATMLGTGLPAGFDDIAYTITIGPIPTVDHGKIVCLDSVFYPPSGPWKWEIGLVDSVSMGWRIPIWNGPHCFTALDVGGSQSLQPNPAVIKLETEEGNPSDGQSLQIDVFNGTPLAFTLSNGPSWLELSATTGTTPETITASSPAIGLTSDDYRGTVSLTAVGASNSPLEVPCVLRVRPAITVMPYWGVFAFATGGNQAPAETLVVTATDGVSNIPFTANPEKVWLNVIPNFGTTPGTLAVVSDVSHTAAGRIVSSNVTVTPDDSGLTPLQVLYKVEIVDTVVLAVRDIDDGNLPATYTLGQNYPNPFNPTTQIAFELPTRSQVTLTVYNVLGHRVATLVNENLPVGRYETEWDGRSESGVEAASGIYFYRLHTESFTQTKKMILLK